MIWHLHPHWASDIVENKVKINTLMLFVCVLRDSSKSFFISSLDVLLIKLTLSS